MEIDNQILDDAFNLLPPHLRVKAGEEVSYHYMDAGQYLLGMNDVCSSLFYLVSGAVFQYNFKEEMEQNVINLHTPKEWVFNQESFISQRPTSVAIKAYSNCEVIRIGLNEIHKLIETSSQYLALASILNEGKERTTFFDDNANPEKKYQYILQNRPELLQCFPLKMIASYLKISPETLSRVRGLKGL